MAQPHPNQRRLFLPHLFPNLHPHDSILPVLQFPFIAPLGAPLMNGMQCKPIHRAACATGRNKTDTPQAIEALAPQERLQLIRRDPWLWARLVSYAELTPAPGVTTWTCMHRGLFGPALGLPNVHQVASGVRKLWYWFLRQCDTACAVATCELSIQDDVFQQVIQPSNHLLATRYNNSILTPIGPNHPKVGWRLIGPTGHALLGGAPLAAFIPHWGRGCLAHRPDVNVSDSTKAGLHDFVLLAGPDCDQNLAIAEVKTFWAYSDADFLNIFSEVVCTNQGVFLWNRSGNFTSALLKQIWGELYFYCASWGFATNGRKFVIFAKSSPTTLTFSDVKDWNDPHLHRAMAGMQFAAMDGRVQEIPVAQGFRVVVSPPGSQYDQHLIDRLCFTPQNPR